VLRAGADVIRETSRPAKNAAVSGTSGTVSSPAATNSCAEGTGEGEQAEPSRSLGAAADEELLRRLEIRAPLCREAPAEVARRARQDEAAGHGSPH